MMSVVFMLGRTDSIATIRAHAVIDWPYSWPRKAIFSSSQIGFRFGAFDAASIRNGTPAQAVLCRR